MLDQAFPTSQTPATEMILVQTASGRLATADLNAVARDVRTRVGSLPSVIDLQAPERSNDGRAALIRFDIRGDSEKAADKVAPIEAAVAAVANDHPGLRVEQFGDASSGKQFDDQIAKDFQKAEFLSIPITLIILLLAFGALLAAGIPVLLGLTSVFTAFGLTAVSSQFIATGESTQILMMLIGMAVAVDYSLFYLKREREERARGAGKLAALEAAAATSGHAVLVSGLTVMVSLAGMFFMGVPDGGAMAIGSILVVGVAVLGSLTVLPAVLAKLGDRVHRSRLPLLRRLKREERDSRIWGFVLGHVMRRPLVALIAGVGILAVLALPAIGMQTKQTGLDDISRSTFPVLKTYDHIQQSFPGERSAAEVVIQAADVSAPGVQAGIADLKREALATGKVLGPIAETEISRDGTVARVDLPLAGDGSNGESMNALAAVREIAPATIGSVPGTTVDVGGEAATTKDGNDNLSTHAPLVFGFVLAMAFLLLLVTFRSIVIPIKAILLNLLSVAAAFGVITLVFQHGFGEIIGMPHTQGHRVVAAGLPVRDPVRPLDGLPRVHPEPHQGGLGSGHRQRRGRRAGHPRLGRRRDRSGRRHDRGVLDLRDDVADRPAGVRRRPRGRRRDRRHTDPRRRAPGGDEAARQVELVHAAQPRLGSLLRPRREPHAAGRRRVAPLTQPHIGARPQVCGDPRIP